MEEITPEAIELVATNAPHFLAQVRASLSVSKPGRRPSAVQITLDEITPEGDIMLLYACVWYSLSLGVPVTFVPSKRRRA